MEDTKKQDNIISQNNQKKPIADYIVAIAIMLVLISVLIFIVITVFVSERPKENEEDYQPTTILYDSDVSEYEKYFKNYKPIIVKNVALIEDHDGERGLYFNGYDNYIQLESMPATIDWESGFVIELKIRYKIYANVFGAIFDFDDEVDLNSISLGYYHKEEHAFIVRKFGFEGNQKMSASSIGKLEEDELYTYKLVVEKVANGYEISSYKVDDNVTLLDRVYHQGDNLIKNGIRRKNFIGRSNNIWEDLFYGTIYYMKVSDSKGQTIFEIDPNIDRKD